MRSSMRLQFLLLLFVFSIPCIANQVSNKSKELTGLQKQIKAISQKLNAFESKKNSLLAELKRLDISYGKSIVILQQLENQIKILNASLKKNQLHINTKQQHINSQKRSLESQVKAAFGMGKNEKLKLMLNQQNPALSNRMMIYYQYLNNARLNKIDRFKQDLQALETLKKTQTEAKQQLNEKLKQRQSQRQFFLSTKNDRKALLVKLNKKIVINKQQLSQFKKNEKRLKRLILSLQQVMDEFPMDEGSVLAFAKLKGKLAWPSKGRIIKKFGAKRSDSRWDGVLIKAKEGVNIRAVTRGRVVFADWLRGYGLLSIIDHGKGYMTLYAFNQSLYKSVGEWVDPGTIIASVGRSGGQSDAGLYFGIRYQGKPVNPIKWCKKIRKGLIR